MHFTLLKWVIGLPTLSRAYLARWVIKINPAVRSQSNPQQLPVFASESPTVPAQ